MDGTTGTAAASIQDVNKILEMATAQAMDMDKKLVRLAVETAVGAETGKGGAMDVSA